MEATIDSIQGRIKERFSHSKRLLTFDEYLDLVEKDPARHLRASYHYLLDAIQHYGHYPKQERGREVKRYKIFDQEDFLSPQPLVGQELLQNRFVEILTGFVRSGKSDKLITLYGPNGSSKSSFVKTLFEGLEKYSATDNGILFTFSWIFPEESIQKGKLGIGAPREGVDPSESFAKLEQDKIGAIVRSELHENPLFLIPKEDRAIFFDGLFEKADGKDLERREKYKRNFLEAEVSHKNSLIFEALLNEYQGDYRKVMRHVRVERLYLSRSIRNGLVMIEPKFSVDANIRQVTLDRSMANLPPALQSLNLFQLEGDLVDGNRGIVEYSDFLKRPVESFKYLLNTCESKNVNLGNVVVSLDTVFMGTTNDRQLEAFREHPEFYSFKSRLELVRVPYLLRFSDEEKIYEQTARDVCADKELMPFTCRALALWAVLTRLKKPLTKNKSSVLVKILENLTPLEKAKLYDSGDTPERLNDEERRELGGHIEELANEHGNHVYYEGLLGASARELKVVLQTAAQNSNFKTLGPNVILNELRKLVKRVSDYDYLRQEPVPGGYHDFEAFIDIVSVEWLDWVDSQMRKVISLHSDIQIEDSFASYIKQVTA
ncbi:serine protein kinase PrkA, partial [bacterium]|nr:serine protein kinase PrkA [bacterium]